jgi:flavin reductase (DIM6/NTAB) family NADH-FMN oxidoreductase RutF
MSFDQIEFRNSLGNFATGVAIVTVQCGDKGDLGLTINSFASVSLDPPLVLWSINRNSDLFETFIGTETFTVNILNENQQDFSNQFSKKEEHSLEAYDWERTQNGCKYVPDSLAHFDCETYEQLDGGDHIIFVGKVTHFESRGGKPLLFAQGKYQKIQD